ncbi:protein NYNRIN-like [Epinephelus fuscoguttatus]|uniref:protein NYNRIN-like n=1 Tax=Epinephelus fuscoguttatus TaxID=293821 RepID=UPI0020D1C9FB|nr:protein NYNRIN-like [Epinephelus fuscoguttatus]
MKRLQEALMKPAQVAVIKCKGHDKAGTAIARGNEAADTAAKRKAGYSPQYIMLQTEKTVHDLLPPCDVNMLIAEQQKASPQELTVWKERGAVRTEGVWRSPDGRPVLPAGLMRSVLQEAHGVTHCGKVQMVRGLTHWWHPFLPAMIENHIRECKICTEYNVRPTVKPHQGKFPLPKLPGQEVIIDYTDMIERVGGHRYLLVAVDAYTGWREAIPAKSEDTKTVIKFLINQYIPRHGFPKRIRSENGTHFKNKDLQQVEKALGLKHTFGTVYHPQSQGKVEGMNQSIKGKMGKICAQTKMSWVDALPLALMSIRSSVNSLTGFMPYELKTGHQFPGPGAGTQTTEEIESPMQYKPYYDQLTALVSAFSKQVTTDPPTSEWVLLKVIKRKWSEPRWTGPYKVVERTSHAVKLQRKGDTWYHWNWPTALGTQLGDSLNNWQLMTVQNRIALDMLLAEKGGVCSMFQGLCCTFIPNNTAPDGSVTKALEGLRTLSEEMHEHSGIDKPLGGIFENRIIVTAVERKHPQPPPYQMTQMETATLLGEPPTDSDSDSDSGEDKV